MSNLPPQRHRFDVAALQLKQYPYGEGDQILLLLTREYGLLRAIAKGTRKPRSKLAGLLAPLRCNQLTLVCGRNLHRVEQAASLQSFSGLHKDYDALMAGLVMGEVTAAFCQEEDPQPALFDAFCLGLLQLQAGFAPRALLLWFLLYLLENQGFYQDWRHCAGCERPLQPQDRVFLLGSAGVLLCQPCKPGAEGARYLYPEQLLALQQLQQAPEPLPLDLDERRCNGLLWFLQQHLEQLSGKSLNSFAFLYPLPEAVPASPPTTPVQQGV